MKLFQVTSNLDSNLRAIVWANDSAEAARIAWQCANDSQIFVYASAKEITAPDIPTMLIMVEK